MARRPDFSYINKKGKRISGTAAFLHHVFTECGGVQRYNDEVGKVYIEAFINESSDKINDALSKQIRKKYFKKVG